MAICLQTFAFAYLLLRSMAERTIVLGTDTSHGGLEHACVFRGTLLVCKG